MYLYRSLRVAMILKIQYRPFAWPCEGDGTCRNPKATLVYEKHHVSFDSVGVSISCKNAPDRK